MKDRSRSVYDFGLLMVIVLAVALATVTVYSQTVATPQNQAAAQTPSSSPTPTPINWSTDPALKRFVFRSIGPASMGGRIDDIAVSEQNPYVMYIAFATNGVWKSTNNGTTFTPIFDTYTTHSIGDIAIAPSDPNIVWVGTGEPNNRQSSSYGDGIYKSTDAGKTFTKMGLEDSQTIGRIVIDPKDPNTVYVAVIGHLFGPNKERGVFKTTDGGKTWTNVKFIDEDTGFTDIAMDASDSKILYAASYQRRRTNFGFNGGGPGSGIWKTIDAGKTWKKLEGAGLPESVLGRIGLDVSRSNPKRRLRADGSGHQHRNGRRRTDVRRASRSESESFTIRIRVARGRTKSGCIANAAASGSEALRSLAFRRQGKNLARCQQRKQSPDVLQPDSCRSKEPGDGLRRRAELQQVDRRRQDLQIAASRHRARR